MSVEYPQSTSPRTTPSQEIWGDIPAQKRVRAMVPPRVLMPIQTVQEYRRRSMREVNAALSSRGLAFLEENPIYAVALVCSQDLLILAILDGHHRTRYSPKYGIREVPTEITDTRTLAEVTHDNVDRLTTRLLAWIGEAAVSYRYKDLPPQGQYLKLDQPIRVSEEVLPQVQQRLAALR